MTKANAEVQLGCAKLKAEDGDDGSGGVQLQNLFGVWWTLAVHFSHSTAGNAYTQRNCSR